LKDKTIKRALVFTRTKHGADRVVTKLESAGHPAEAIHGNKNQGQRTRALDAFKKGQARLLVATEIAARGIDVDNVSHVINFDLPNVPETYVHRIGRTGRAGAAGTAISLCDKEERAYVLDIERLIRKSIPASDRAAPASRLEAGTKPKIGRSPAGRPGKRQQARHAGTARKTGHKSRQHGGDSETAYSIGSVAFMRHPSSARAVASPRRNASPI
jgi:ATP-dependent RNA helicase RhlE